MNRVYMCIDLKSFYASVECVERGLDPMTTNLVVADESRTEKTICLAVSPSLKSYGLSGRSRLFEVIGKVKQINNERRKKINNYRFRGKSFNNDEINNNPYLELDYIKAVPRMNCYMKYSTNIYNIYLKYISAEDIHVYSIDEVFCDITTYLKLYKLNAHELASKIIKDVYDTTGITATCGIGTNLYLAKVAMDIVAKHIEPNKDGVRIAELDEISYRKLLWNHKPLTDFWRIGRGYAKKLENNNLYTMGDIARFSINNEDRLYKLFGINAELLIDHAWGYEFCTIHDIKNYKPSTNSLSSGQVLHEPYDYKKAKLIVNEMMDLLVLDIVDKHLITDHIVLTVGYDIENLTNPIIRNKYDGDIVKDFYGRYVPKSAHGTIRLDYKTSSTKIIMKAINNLYDRIVNPLLLVRRINIAVCNLVDEYVEKDKVEYQQLNLFLDNKKEIDLKIKSKEEEKVERNVQRTIIDIKKKYGKNAILKGMNYIDGATTIQRNLQIGGHKG